jgi:hypothetical protein
MLRPDAGVDREIGPSIVVPSTAYFASVRPVHSLTSLVKRVPPARLIPGPRSTLERALIVHIPNVSARFHFQKERS